MCKETTFIHSHPCFFSNPSFLPFTVVYSQYFTVLGDRMMVYHHEEIYLNFVLQQVLISGKTV